VKIEDMGKDPSALLIGRALQRICGHALGQPLDERLNLFEPGADILGRRVFARFGARDVSPLGDEARALRFEPIT
jgi:hypothetical protein